MATKKNTYQGKKQERPPRKSGSSTDFLAVFRNIRLDGAMLQERKVRMIGGLATMFLAIAMGIGMVSYLFTGQADQSIVESLGPGQFINEGLQSRNVFGLLGALLSHLLIFRFLGLSAFFIPPIVFALGYETAFEKRLFEWRRFLLVVAFVMFWSSVFFGYIVHVFDLSQPSFLCGAVGFRIALLCESLVGFGTVLFLVFSLAIFLVYFKDEGVLYEIKDKVQENYEATRTAVRTVRQSVSDTSTVLADRVAQFRGDPARAGEYAGEEDQSDSEQPTSTQDTLSEAKPKKAKDKAAGESSFWKISKLIPKAAPQKQLDFFIEDGASATPAAEIPVAAEPPIASIQQDSTEERPTLHRPVYLPDVTGEDTEAVVEAAAAAPVLTPTDALAPAEEGELAIDDASLYDPTLDLAHYEFPHLDLLTDTGTNKVKVTKEELETNKDKIVETLSNFKIGITSIKATIGPTVTLYEIVPDAGIKISRIKSLEDDIALSLAALGIRIIAPIPGRGTIGIEVPNKNREMVSIRSVLASEKFQHADKDLPIALGKTISNEVFITDLSKMPHLLMAGATGQGKSVGLNVVLTSLLYKKHPAELKFVLVDPKKVELSLFNKIERHFLATLPDTEEAIVTDTSKAVNVLKSLCVEMDDRYSLLKAAGCRNIKEYNRKFVSRRLLPTDGHRFLPYIVLVIDELADLMMTAGKEVELPIARLAQLARAIGIHLIIATQRPSVDVITGIIKANFPARLSFRVTSGVDSRTILDTKGAEQLIGMGDMLLSNGSDIIRLQCAFVDTDEVERLCDFIGGQRGYRTPYLLPEVESDSDGAGKNVDLSDRDDMFEQAARIVVQHQQGSTSLIQRKLSLGYNRAGRIIDQLEAAGIVGPFEGSKARQVLVVDEYQLEQVLNTIR